MGAGSLMLCVRGARMRRYILLLVSVLAFVGCRPGKDIRLQRKVETSEVVGTWSLRAASLETAEREGRREGFSHTPGQTYQIDFRADGSCRFSSLIQRPLKYVDCEGIWQLHHNSDNPNELQIELKRKEGGYLFALEFTEQDGKLMIWEYLGDPDVSKFLIYGKDPNIPLQARP